MRTESFATFILALTLSLCTGAAAQATGQGPSNSDTVFTPPRWPSPPVPSDDYPDFASALDLKGTVTLNCIAKVSGRVSDCRVESAVPRGIGFEQQALSDAATFTITPAQTSEGPVERRVEFTVNFSLDEEHDKPRPWKGPKPTPEQLASAKETVLLGVSQGIELPKQDLDHIDLSDLDVDVREKVQAVLSARPMPRVEDERLLDLMAEGLAQVFAKHGVSNLFEVPLKHQDQFDEDFITAMVTLGAKHIQDDEAWVSQVRNDFCAIHDCGPQD